MVRPTALTAPKRKAVWGACALLVVSMVAMPLAGQGQSARPADGRLLDALLDRSAMTAAGTYVLTASALEPAKDELPAIVQADVLRGADGAIRVLVALGAEAPQAAIARLRLVTTNEAVPRVVADADGSGGPGPMRLVHEFSLAPGEYDLQAAVGRRRSEGGLIATLAKSRLVVPDVWRGRLAMTPIVLANIVGAAPRGSDQPFTFGPTALSPATSPSFKQQGAVNVAFRVYNWRAEQGERPDLTVEYLFFQQLARRMVFFNKIKPQQLGADTLGTSFDPATGVVASGMTVPLVSFPFGGFQLTVRVTDNRSHASSEQLVRFSVTP